MVSRCSLTTLYPQPQVHEYGDAEWLSLQQADFLIQ